MDFYPEFKKLALSKPKNAIHSRASENAVYGDYFFRSKNIYLSYFCFESTDCFYSEYLSNCRDCIDCIHVSASELAYECTDCTSLYNCSFLQDCHNCSNVDFSVDLLNCKDCFGCFGLRHRQFCIFNKQYSESEYREKVLELKKKSSDKILEILAPEFEKHARLYAHVLKSENSLGDYIYYSNNCFRCFNIRNIENAAYVTEIFSPENSSSNCVDCDLGTGLQDCYETFNANLCINCNFLANCFQCEDSEYLIDCYNCSNCFGCVNLSNKQYCVLNRQLTRDEYLLAIQKIKTNLRQQEQYGKTLAQVFK